MRHEAATAMTTSTTTAATTAAGNMITMTVAGTIVGIRVVATIMTTATTTARTTMTRTMPRARATTVDLMVTATCRRHFGEMGSLFEFMSGSTMRVKASNEMRGAEV